MELRRKQRMDPLTGLKAVTGPDLASFIREIELMRILPLGSSVAGICAGASRARSE
ncbi:hypothetical protein [Lichenifustis flavocetrariae]|uniref:Uncharacterized protein n=1 Tax=Lichenifustis flavocetrariae TaxID=2949735 RepID=A0AA41Z463_9HYPH|nr:hypothetical protein [Lichenifustis flavocetrariae]MCW6510163.1 hypothetical protein [Lichenifustis flavocetrariae]